MPDPLDPGRPDQEWFSFDHPSPAEALEARPGLAWERAAGIGFLSALLGTIGLILRSPTQAFSQMTVNRRAGRAFFFYMLVALPACYVAAMYDLMGEWLMYQNGRPSETFEQIAELPPVGQMVAVFVMFSAVLITGPIALTVSIFIVSTLWHVALLVIPGPRQAYATTFKVYAYAVGATAVFYYIPLCGGVLLAIWLLVASIYGIMAAHGRSAGHAALAVLWPLLLCGCGVGLFSLATTGLLGAELHEIASRILERLAES